MAQAFPRSRFHGFDVHPASIDEARRNAHDAWVAGRVTFDMARAVDYPGGNYGLICFFDCLHDMGDPVAAARHAAEVLAPDGTVMLVEPFANDRVEDNLSLVARLYYAASTLICCAHAISEGEKSSSLVRRQARHGSPKCSTRRASHAFDARPRHPST